VPSVTPQLTSNSTRSRGSLSICNLKFKLHQAVWVYAHRVPCVSGCQLAEETGVMMIMWFVVDVRSPESEFESESESESRYQGGLWPRMWCGGPSRHGGCDLVSSTSGSTSEGA
jgi:hypothetical protein